MVKFYKGTRKWSNIREFYFAPYDTSQTYCTFFQLLFKNLTIAFNIKRLFSTLPKVSQQCNSWLQQSMFWDQQSNNLLLCLTNVTNYFNNYQNWSTFSQLKATKHQILINKAHISQQCIKLINNWSKNVNNVVWKRNLISYRLLVILVTIVQLFVYVLLIDWLIVIESDANCLYIWQLTYYRQINSWPIATVFINAYRLSQNLPTSLT